MPEHFELGFDLIGNLNVQANWNNSTTTTSISLFQNPEPVSLGFSVNSTQLCEPVNLFSCHCGAEFIFQDRLCVDDIYVCKTCQVLNSIMLCAFGTNKPYNVHVQISLCQACSGLCSKHCNDIMPVAEICKIIYQEAAESLKRKSLIAAPRLIYETNTSILHETDISSACEYRLQLIAQSLQIVLESFDVVLDNWTTHNPNAGFANALWESLSKIQVYDRERRVSEH